MRISIVFVVVSLLVGTALVATAGNVVVPVERLTQLVQAVGTTPTETRDELVTILDALTEQILLHLADQGLPQETIVVLQDRYSELVQRFLSGSLTQGVFGAEITKLAENLNNLYEEQGVSVFPVDRLLSIGLNPYAILELKGQKELSGLEIAAIAQSIIGSFSPVALPAAPPTDLPRWSDGGPEVSGIRGAPPAELPTAGPSRGSPGGDAEDTDEE